MNTHLSSLHLADANRTRELGASFGRALLHTQLDQPLIVHMNGELGAGKTTFVSGLLNEMGYVGSVRSPTYTLVESYEFVRNDIQSQRTIFQVMHMDFYRLTDAAQLEELGIRDMLVPNTVLLIEWAVRAEERLPPASMAINLAYEDEGRAGRTVELMAYAEVAKSIIDKSLNFYAH